MAAGPGSPAVDTEPWRPVAEEAFEAAGVAAAGVAVVGGARTFG